MRLLVLHGSKWQAPFEGMWLVWQDWDHIHLAIVMEFCGNGTLYKMIGGARHISYLPEDIRCGRAAPRTERERSLKASPHTYYKGLHFAGHVGWTPMP